MRPETADWSLESFSESAALSVAAVAIDEESESEISIQSSSWKRERKEKLSRRVFLKLAEMMDDKECQRVKYIYESM